MSVVLIVGTKSTQATSHAVPGEFGLVCRRDRRTDGRQTVTLRFPLDAASVIIQQKHFDTFVIFNKRGNVSSNILTSNSVCTSQCLCHIKLKRQFTRH